MIFNFDMLLLLSITIPSALAHTVSIAESRQFHSRHMCSSEGEISNIAKRVVFPGYQLVATQALAGLGITATCESVLYQPLKCDNFTSQLGSSSYHGSLGDANLTASVCDATCSTALSTFHRRVAAACATTPNLYPGFPVLALIDSIWGGWNETCVKDNTTTAGFCNGQQLNPVIS
jgi:hypothetical protein